MKAKKDIWRRENITKEDYKIAVKKLQEHYNITEEEMKKDMEISFWVNKVKESFAYTQGVSLEPIIGSIEDYIEEKGKTSEIKNQKALDTKEKKIFWEKEFKKQVNNLNPLAYNKKVESEIHIRYKENVSHIYDEIDLNFHIDKIKKEIEIINKNEERKNTSIKKEIIYNKIPVVISASCKTDINLVEEITENVYPQYIPLGNQLNILETEGTNISVYFNNYILYKIIEKEVKESQGTYTLKWCKFVTEYIELGETVEEHQYTLQFNPQQTKDITSLVCLLYNKITEDASIGRYMTYMFNAKLFGINTDNSRYFYHEDDSIENHCNEYINQLDFDHILDWIDEFGNPLFSVEEEIPLKRYKVEKVTTTFRNVVIDFYGDEKWGLNEISKLKLLEKNEKLRKKLRNEAYKKDPTHFKNCVHSLKIHNNINISMTEPINFNEVVYTIKGEFNTKSAEAIVIISLYNNIT